MGSLIVMEKFWAIFSLVVGQCGGIEPRFLVGLIAYEPLGKYLIDTNLVFHRKLVSLPKVGHF